MQKEDVKKIKELDMEIKKKKSLATSIKEGTAAGMASDLGSSLITPLATEIGANTIHIGFLNAFSGISSPIAMIRGDRLMEKQSRKSILTKFVLCQALMWIPIALLGLLYHKQILTGFLPWVLIILYMALISFGGLAHPAWFSWMGDLVNEKTKGRYFSKRNVITGTAGVIAMLLGGWTLKYFKSIGFVFIGFGILFFFVVVFRLISRSYLKKMYEPKFKLEKKDYFSFWAFLKRYDDFGKFAVYLAFFNFAIMIASPFFGFYMLKSLGYESNYLLYMIVNLAGTAFYLIFTPLIGRFSDKYGNLRLMYISNILFAINPIIWIFVKTPLAIIFIPQVVSGLANAAMTIGITNYTYDGVSPQKRGLCNAYTNLLIGMGTLVGSLIGGYLIRTLQSSTMNSFFIVFAIAGVARLAVGLFFLPQLKEMRKVKKFKISDIHMHMHHHLSNPLRHLRLGVNPVIAHGKAGKAGKSKLFSAV